MTGQSRAAHRRVLVDAGEATVPDLEFRIDSAFQGEDGSALADRARIVDEVTMPRTRVA
jgi:hypothetical protein